MSSRVGSIIARQLGCLTVCQRSASLLKPSASMACWRNEFSNLSMPAWDFRANYPHISCGGGKCMVLSRVLCPVGSSFIMAASCDARKLLFEQGITLWFYIRTCLQALSSSKKNNLTSASRFGSCAVAVHAPLHSFQPNVFRIDLNSSSTSAPAVVQ